MKALSEKGARRITGAYIVVALLLLITIGCTRLSFLGLGPDYTLAVVAFGLVLLFWVLILCMSRLGLGLRTYVQQLYARNGTSCDTSIDSGYHSKLIDKLNAMRDTCATFASITIAVIAITAAIVLGTKLINFPIQLIAGGTTLLLVIGAILLIHVVDACDTAMNPRIDTAMLEKIRRLAMNYYAIGLSCLIGAVLLSVAIVTPYLTAATSMIYMGVVWHYFFIWRPVSS